MNDHCGPSVNSVFFAFSMVKALLVQFPSLVILRTRDLIGQGRAKNITVNQSTKDLPMLCVRHPIIKCVRMAYIHIDT